MENPECPVCHKEMLLAGMLFEDDEAVERRFVCETCKTAYRKYKNKKLVKILPIQKTEAQLLFEKKEQEKKEAQMAKRRAYNEKTAKRKARAKKAETQSLDSLLNVDIYEDTDKEKCNPLIISKDELKEKMAAFDKKGNRKAKASLIKPSVKEDEKSTSKKVKSDDEEKKARAREYHRQRYLKLKAMQAKKK